MYEMTLYSRSGWYGTWEQSHGIDVEVDVEAEVEAEVAADTWYISPT